MRDRHFDVVVSDMRMPGMLGNELLEAVMERSPDTVRFILSGHADQDLICKSIGSTHQYMSKPCDTEVLVNAIERAFAIRDLLHRESLKKLVAQIKTIPSLPDLYLQVMQEMKSPNASVHRVGQIVSRDIGMSAKVLQLVNSAFFGTRRRVTDPAQAASLLGIDILKSVVLMVQVFSQMPMHAVKGWSMDALWEHSLTVGRCAQAIARLAKNEKRALDDAFMAGLFHDLGKLVLVANLPQGCLEATELAARETGDMLAAEEIVFGATHAEIGAYLLGLWGFSDPIVEAAAFHHRPADCLDRQFGSLTAVHVANAVVGDVHPVHPGIPHAALDPDYLRQTGHLDSLPTWREACREILEQGTHDDGKQADGKNPVR
jgi:HD-like signal output (HDOD) protein